MSLILGQLNSTTTITPCILKIHFNTILHIYIVLPTRFFSSRFSTKVLYAFLITTTRATYLTHLILNEQAMPENLDYFILPRA